MIKSGLGKVMWVGRATVFVVGLAVILGLVLGATSVAFGANGATFILGRVNEATATTQLNGSVAGKAAMLITNSNKAAGSKALHLNVADGNAPMAVNSDTRVPNLNADKLDNLNPSQIKGAKAFAVVDPDGGLVSNTPGFDEFRTSGFSAVERINTGDYCLTAPGLDRADRPAVVSVDWLHTVGPEAVASAIYDSEGCTDGRFRVKTERIVLSDGALTDTPADNVGFVVVVP